MQGRMKRMVWAFGYKVKNISEFRTPDVFLVALK